MRVAIVQDWLTGMRGGERVLEQMLQVFPDAELFTLLHRPGTVSSIIESRRIHTSWIQQLPFAAQTYRYYLPFFPRAIEAFDLRGFDLVLSSSHCVAKGVRVPRGVPHICYCHTPMRYLYDQSRAYARRFSWPVRLGFAGTRERLRRWDQRTSRNVTHFIANSAHVRDRIRSLYGQEASVLFPPVEVDRFEPAVQREDYYVSLSALVPYKRVDLVVDAFNALQRRLVVIGSGPELSYLRKRAGSNITFTGWLPDHEVAALLAPSRGLVFAGVEDFGISLVEAQAAGVPVIALAAGGALETVTEGTGVLFHEPSRDAIMRAVGAAEMRSFSPAALRSHAQRFRPERFRNGLRAEVDAVLTGAEIVGVIA
jgi:glycosyltransferase involved in cell wall biosynthesis